AERVAAATAATAAEAATAGQEATLASLAITDTLSQEASRPGLPEVLSDSVVNTGSDEPAIAPTVPRHQSYGPPTAETGTTTTGSSFGWRAIKGGSSGSASNTDSGYGRIEKLCDPCYLGLAADQVKVLEDGGGWAYYQATLTKNQTQDLAAVLAKEHGGGDEANNKDENGDDKRNDADEEDEEEEEEEKAAALMIHQQLAELEVSL
ncbi:hypothetical protein BGZ94_005491, partial [Podila epigama]